VDDARIAALTAGLCWVNRFHALGRRQASSLPVPYPVALLKPFFSSDEALRRAGLMPPEHRLSVPPDFLRRISDAGGSSLARTALPRLKAAGIKVGHQDPLFTVADPARLAATMTVPVTQPAIKSLAGILAGVPATA
jgi:hypothetical protein